MCARLARGYTQNHSGSVGENRTWDLLTASPLLITSEPHFIYTRYNIGRMWMSAREWYAPSKPFFFTLGGTYNFMLRYLCLRFCGDGKLQCKHATGIKINSWSFSNIWKDAFLRCTRVLKTHTAVSRTRPPFPKNIHKIYVLYFHK